MSTKKKPTAKMIKLKEFAELLRQFDLLFPTLEHIWRGLLYRALLNGLIFCKKCQGTSFKRLRGTRHGECLRCGVTQSLTANSFLKNVRVPRAWLFAMWLMGKGYVCSFNLFHEVVEISPSSAAHIYKSLALAVDDACNENAVIVQSAEFVPAFCHRSSETPKLKHPRDEESFFDKDEVSPSRAAADQFSSSSETLMSDEESLSGDKEAAALRSLFAELNDDELKIASMLSTSPIHADILTNNSGMLFPVVASSLTMLELGGIAQRLPGEFYILGAKANCRSQDGQASPENMPTEEQMKLIKEFVQFIKFQSSGCSRKNLQLHLNNYWLKIDRTRWNFEAISHKCFQAGYLGSRKIARHVSQLLVKFPCGAQLKPQTAAPFN